ncbi:hypothetical protein [Actinomadura rubrisoli]|uniref:Thioesterase domain-containing protein n=1 Tax=Actinomadura rubrisoli TaxID=2530368 RepID=A0A4R5C3H5_9ACTN|nr:hypothetical protein [Actinomadura rubrisoli]TDD94231.1 hypothetical protein E1298_07240 [Actinomadura rubrisoli]
MSISAAWKTLAESENSAGIILAVDFDTTGRPEARFSDLVAHMGPGHTVWESVPPPGGTLGPDDYIEHWAAPIEAGRRPVRALTGFCAGAVYAAALAERIRAVQDTEPRLILFDPELSTAQTLMWQYHKVMGFMSAVLSADEIAEARAAGQRLHDRDPEVGALKDALIALARETGEPALTKAGLDEARREELFEVFESFLGYLAAAGRIDPLPEWRKAIAFSSASPLSGLNAMRASGLGGEVTVAEEIGIDVDHGTMLAHAGLAASFTALLP